MRCGQEMQNRVILNFNRKDVIELCENAYVSPVRRIIINVVHPNGKKGLEKSAMMGAKKIIPY